MRTRGMDRQKWIWEDVGGSTGTRIATVTLGVQMTEIAYDAVGIDPARRSSTNLSRG